MFGGKKAGLLFLMGHMPKQSLSKSERWNFTKVLISSEVLGIPAFLLHMIDFQIRIYGLSSFSSVYHFCNPVFAPPRWLSISTKLQVITTWGGKKVNWWYSISSYYVVHQSLSNKELPNNTTVRLSPDWFWNMAMIFLYNWFPELQLSIVTTIVSLKLLERCFRTPRWLIPSSKLLVNTILGGKEMCLVRPVW